MEHTQFEKYDNESLRQKIFNVCQAKHFCGICFETDILLKCTDTELVIVANEKTIKVPLNDVIFYVFNHSSQHIISSKYVCRSCTEKFVQSYLFIYNARQLSNILHKCVDELESKTFDATNQLKQLDNYENSNIVILLEQEAEMKEYIDIDKVTVSINATTNATFINDVSVKEPENIEIDEETNISNEFITIKNASENLFIENLEKSPVSNAILDEDITQIEKPYMPLENNEKEIVLQCEKEYESVANSLQIDLNNHNKGIINETNSENTVVKRVLTSRRRKRRVLPFLTYKCCRCRNILPSYKGWKLHEKTCKNLKIGSSRHIFKCKICVATFVSLRSLNSHYKTHSKVRCKVCQFIIPQEDLSDHIKINHEDYIHMCKLCKFFSFTTDGLRIHMKKYHSGSKCALCFKKVPKNELKLHKCRFKCLECVENVCMHYKYLVSYREQVLSDSNKIKCVDCDYVCPRREALLGHVNREHLDHHPFTCAHCSQQFYSRTTLRYHLNQFHKERHICSFCDQEFNTIASLNKHKETCRNTERTYLCDLCTSSFNVLEELANHVKLRHDKESYDCNLCERKFLVSIKLQEHMFKVHNGLQMKRKKSILNCPICNMRFENKKQLLQHTDTHGSGERFPCRDCEADFDSIKKLHAHVRIHYDDVIQCVDCKKVLTTTFFPHHMVYCKPGREEKDLYTCETCGKTYNSESQLKLHLKVHIAKVPCPICKKPTKPVYMKNHIKYMHSKPKSPKKTPKAKTKYYVKCEWCQHMLSRQGEMESHVNRFHLHVKPYKCNYCHKSFFGKERLQHHLITHTTSKTCYCTVCDKKFENKACLKLHMRRHTGYTPYTCEFCGERFMTSSIMNTHKIKKHTEKSIACPLCESMFHLTRDMRSHFKKVHWKQNGKKFDPRDVKELSEEFYHLFEDGRQPKVQGESLNISSKYNEKFG